MGVVYCGVDDVDRVRLCEGSNSGVMGDAMEPRFRWEGWKGGGVEGVVVMDGLGLDMVDESTV